ncbi:NAD(P)/FAD-dependent oxidoreductase [Gemmata sp. JC673]|uniref:NADH:ubiquinone reductase (non-electrogenic) n=1 Tax=Gemmata algarum TaxID=2975278 RepID=A0ABU5F1Y1_9BACT|nr:NAD(P)/FAD-dependent oxidoreductase [Gemmata algarum]MDY3561406.1 NAD(P)/FAD-dependent oxidoreductase [Gemmata algarum]
MSDGTTAHKVVIIGGGFGGLVAAQSLNKTPAEVTLIDRRNFHLFQPLLYQVATGALSPANIASPLRSILKRQKNTHVLLGEVTGFDIPGKAVLLKDGTRVPFDTLIVATGSTHHYFGKADWAERAPGLKTVEDATEVRRRVLSAFERAERTTDPKERARQLTFVVVGGGPTGVEMAGAISELAKYTLRADFRSVDPATARVVLIEGQPKVLGAFHEKLSAKALKALHGMGIEVMLDAHVNAIEPHYVLVQPDDKAVAPVRIDTETVVWAAGVKASPLGQVLADAIGGVTVGRGGHVPVNPDCTVGNRPDIFVIGDMASLPGTNGKPLPGLAPVATQQGEYVAGVIVRRLKGETPKGPFRYFDKGTMATIGRGQAVAESMGFRFSGLLAWLAWLFIHIMYLARFENRMLVLFQWFWNYVTRNRTARLITGERPTGTRGA